MSYKKKIHHFLFYSSRCRAQTHPGYIASAVCGKTKATLWGRGFSLILDVTGVALSTGGLDSFIVSVFDAF